MEQKTSLLKCTEKIHGRTSPDLWPEKVPGVWKFNKENNSAIIPGAKLMNRFRTDLDQDDVRLVNENQLPYDCPDITSLLKRVLIGELSELSLLNADQLMEHIKNLQNNAYSLGVEEAKQYARVKFLKLFETRENQW